MDKLILKDLQYSVTLGQFEPERLSKQDIFIDVEFSFDMKKCMESDDVKDALCYDDLQEEIGRFLEDKEYHLLETMAHRLITQLVGKFPLTWIKLLIKKPSALKNAQYVAIEMERHV